MESSLNGISMVERKSIFNKQGREQGGRKKNGRTKKRFNAVSLETDSTAE